MSAFRGVNPETFGRELAGVIAAAIDQRLGTKRPTQAQRMTLPLSGVRKFLSSGKRVVAGLATTASVDRQGDIVVPSGGQWNLPIPLLWQHDHGSPIGVVREATATREGVQIVAEIAEGVARADEVWRLVEASALDSFSIGFLPIKGEPIASGTRWTSWELIEVSVVAVGANRDAKFRPKSAGVKLIQPRPVVKLIQPR